MKIWRMDNLLFKSQTNNPPHCLAHSIWYPLGFSNFKSSLVFLCSLRFKEVFCGLQVKCGEKEIRGCWRFKVTCKICPNDHWQSFKSLFDLLAKHLTQWALWVVVSRSPNVTNEPASQASVVSFDLQNCILGQFVNFFPHLKAFTLYYIQLQDYPLNMHFKQLVTQSL